MIKMVKKYSAEELFKFDGYNKIEILRLVPKSAGVYVYMPRAIVEALHLSSGDHNLVCFIDDSSNFTYLVLTKDSSLAEQLRPVILQKRERAEALHRKMREQLQSQRQQAEVEAAQAAVSIDV